MQRIGEFHFTFDDNKNNPSEKMRPEIDLQEDRSLTTYVDQILPITLISLINVELGINVEGGFYFVEGEIFQIIKEMTEMTAKIAKSLNVEAGINVEVGIYL